MLWAKQRGWNQDADPGVSHSRARYFPFHRTAPQAALGGTQVFREMTFCKGCIDSHPSNTSKLRNKLHLIYFSYSRPWVHFVPRKGNAKSVLVVYLMDNESTVLSQTLCDKGLIQSPLHSATVTLMLVSVSPVTGFLTRSSVCTSLPRVLFPKDKSFFSSNWLFLFF